MLEALIADIRYALRWLRRSPGFTATAIVSLAVGIGLNTAIFTLVDAVLFRPLPVERPDRLVDVYTNSSDGDTYATASYPDYLDMKAKNDVFTDMLAFSLSLNAVKIGDASRLALGEVVTGSYFQVLGVRPLIGRALQPGDDRPGAPRVAVISHRLWAREFGSSTTALGRSIRIRNQPYTVVGIAPPRFTGMFPVVAAELWTPLAHVEDVEPAGIIDSVPSPEGTGRLDRRGYRWLFVKGRLEEGATVAAANANLAVIAKQLESAYPATNKDRRAAVLRTSDVHTHPDADRMLLPIGAGLMVVVGLVLLIACANVASMLLARASARQREIGIRLAIGASRGRLLRQLLTETIVVCAIGAAAGLGLAAALTRLALAIQLPIPLPLTFALQIDLRVLAFTAAATLVAALAAGLAPALRATKPRVAADLKGDLSTTLVGSRRWALGDGLVAAQIGVTFVLLVVAGLLGRSFAAAGNVQLGFDPDGIAIVSTDVGLVGYDDVRAKEFFERALERVRAIPGVSAVGLAERTAFSINYNRSTVFLPERHTPADKGLTIDSTRVSAGYFEAMGVPIVQGRGFNAADTPASPGVVIVNETLAQTFWPDANPIGRRLHRSSLTGPSFEVVGVSADHKISTVGEKPTPYLHFAYTQNPGSGQAIVARTRADAGALVDAIRRELAALEPNVVLLDRQTMRAQVGATLLPARLGALAVGLVGVVAMILAAIGLYGVIAYSVARRTREIGIRMALGAPPARVLGLVMRQGMAVAAAGAAGGAVLAFGAARAVSGALYGISPIDPVAWGGALAVLFGVSALANLIPARRAATVDPSVALRAD
jgi:predicted permease